LIIIFHLGSKLQFKNNQLPESTCKSDNNELNVQWNRAIEHIKNY